MSNWLDISTLSSYFNKVGTLVTITGSGGGSGALVYAVTSSGVITGFNIISGGSAYSGTITVTISGSGSGATATATQSGGIINLVSVTAGGTGYQGTAPAWTLNISANAWDTLLEWQGNWHAAVNANQQALSNLASLAVRTMSLPGGSITSLAAGVSPGLALIDSSGNSWYLLSGVTTGNDGTFGIYNASPSGQTWFEITDTGNIYLNGSVNFAATVLAYNGQATSGIGLAPIVAVYDATLGGANIGTTTLITTPLAGEYLVTATISVTRPATSSCTLPAVVVNYVHEDSSASLSVTAIASSTTNTTANVVSTEQRLPCKSGSVLSFSTTGFATSGGTSMQYSLHIRVRYLG